MGPSFTVWSRVATGGTEAGWVTGNRVRAQGRGVTRTYVSLLVAQSRYPNPGGPVDHCRLRSRMRNREDAGKRSGPPLGKGTGVTPPGPHKLMRGRPGGGGEAPPGHVSCSPGMGVGGAWLCATPRSRVAHAARRIGQCAEPGKPPAAYDYRQGTQFIPKGGLRDWYVE